MVINIKNKIYKILSISLIIICFCFLKVKAYPLSVTKDNQNSSFDLCQNSSSAICLELNSNTITFTKDIHKKIAPASLTKIMTILIILDSVENGIISFDDTLTASKNAKSQPGSTIYLDEGEKMKAIDVFKGLVIASGNDCAVCFAEAISGSEENFVVKMNEYVKKLGLKNTNFVNCNGLPIDNHYSTVYDISQIARYLLLTHGDTILKYSSIYEDYLRKDTNPFWLVNTNKLVHHSSIVDGLKTGYDGKLYSLCATAKKNNVRLISVVSGANSSTSRNHDTMQLLNYTFNNYKLLTLIEKDKPLVKINDLSKSPQTYNLISNKDIIVYKEKIIDDSKYSYKLDLASKKVNIYFENNLIETYPLTEDRKVVDANLFDLVKYVLKLIFY